jgi:hypothetical protein
MPNDTRSSRVAVSAVPEMCAWANDCGRARDARGVRASARGAGRVLSFAPVGLSGNSDQSCFGGIACSRPPACPVASAGASIATETNITMLKRASPFKRLVLADAERNAAVSPFVCH